MAGLGRAADQPTEAPALVLAAVAHAEVATVAPFGSADDVVARAVERMVLISSGLRPARRDRHRGRSPAASGGLPDLLRGYASGTVAGRPGLDPARRPGGCGRGRGLADSANPVADGELDGVSPVARPPRT